MALNEVSFFNVNGDEIKLSNLVNQCINFYKLKLEVGETAVTDFNEGSEIRNFLEAFAILEYARLEEESENTRIAFISTSYGQWLDKIGELPFIDMPRIDGVEAEGSVTFTLSVAQETDFTIPSGTIVTSSNTGLDFATITDITIPAGETTYPALVECLTKGVDGNVPAESIDTISMMNVDSDLISVSNPEAFYGGEDYEEDDDYRRRLLNGVQTDGFGTAGWYVNLCTDVPGVHDIKLIPDTDNTPPQYTRKVLVNGYDKPTPDNVLLDVLTELTILENKVLDHNFTVDTPTYTTVDLAITLDVATEISTTNLTETMQLLFDGGDATPAPVSYAGLLINEVLTRDRIVSTLEMYDAVSSVTSVKSSGNEITELTPANNGVLKLGTVTFTQNEV